MEILIGILIPLTIFAIYFAPAFVAHNRKHKDENAIAVLNLFLGWTFLGWVVAMIWAMKN